MAKLAHHPVHTPLALGKVQDWFGKIVIVAAIIGGVVVLFSAMTSHGSVTW